MFDHDPVAFGTGVPESGDNRNVEVHEELASLPAVCEGEAPPDLNESSDEGLDQEPAYGGLLETWEPCTL